MSAGGKVRAAWLHQTDIEAWWPSTNETGRVEVERAFGARVETFYSAELHTDEAWLTAAREYADAGVDIIYACDLTVGELVAQVAAEFPDTRFEHCQGLVAGGNLGAYRAARDEHGYVSGLLAGAATESGILAAVEGNGPPHDLLYLDAWALGVRASNPDAVIETRWLGTYHEEGQDERERVAVAELVAEGADVIGGNLAENPAVVEAAVESGCCASAHDARLCDGDRVLDAATLDWGPHLVRSVGSVLDGSWSARQAYVRYGEGVDNTEPAAWLPAEARARAKAAADAFRAGKNAIWDGPLTDNTGRLVVPAGRRLGDDSEVPPPAGWSATEAYLNSPAMSWLVDNIRGSAR
ncbi:MAG: BMP family ABC transporter substrate-binding protein [Actinobacteria bacterium]|nr:BMP family ABC transporter substrate-binding protein [Actinomycetota bacterium]